MLEKYIVAKKFITAKEMKEPMTGDGKGNAKFMNKSHAPKVNYHNAEQYGTTTGKKGRFKFQRKKLVDVRFVFQNKFACKV